VAVCDVKAESGLRSITRTPLLHTVLPGRDGIAVCLLPQDGAFLRKSGGGNPGDTGGVAQARPRPARCQSRDSRGRVGGRQWRAAARRRDWGGAMDR
jgi:hypothetical protein